MKTKIILLLLFFCGMYASAQETVDITGKWTAQLTTIDEGKIIREVTLPGSLLTNNIGDEPSVDTKWTGSLYDSSYYFNPYMAKYRIKGQMKFPFFLTPNKHFVGHVIYTKTVAVPKTWKKNRVVLFLERPHIETTVFVNGKKVGHRISLSVPHQYDVTSFLIPGKDNVISVDVYNGIENVCVGQDSHSVTDQTQGNWNGIVGRIELRTSPLLSKVGIMNCSDDYRVFADLSSGDVRVVFSDTTVMLRVDNPQPWSEFSPIVYHRSVTRNGRQIPVSFGFRDITIKGRQFYLNGRPIWIRGTVENCD